MVKLEACSKYLFSGRKKKRNSYLADKDKCLSARPLWAPAEPFNQFIHEVYRVSWCWSIIQLLYHFTNLKSIERAVYTDLLLKHWPFKIFKVYSISYQLVWYPTNWRNLIWTKAKGNRSQVIIYISGTIQIKKQDQLPMRREQSTQTSQKPWQQQWPLLGMRLPVILYWKTTHNSVPLIWTALFLVE